MNTYYNKRPAAPKSSQEFIFGTRAVIEAVLAGKDIDKILIRKNLESSLSVELFDALKGLRIPVQRVPVEKLNRVTTKNHQGVVAFLSPIIQIAGQVPLPAGSFARTSMRPYCQAILPAVLMLPDVYSANSGARCQSVASA